jgi:hypothetical protein
MTVRYRVLPNQRRKLPPYDGELFVELTPPGAIGYGFIELHGRRQSIDTRAFERIEEPDAT